MRVNCVGAGPGGLAFAMALKKRAPEIDVTVFERSAAGARQGFGVVLSDGLIGRLAEEDPVTHGLVMQNVVPWDAIEVRCGTGTVRAPGFTLSGISRETFIRILVARCVDLGVRFAFQHEVTHIRHLLGADLLVAADGANSVLRNRYAEEFGSSVSNGQNRFSWLGTTRTFDAFSFAFRENIHGLWWMHAYPYGPMASTFIVEGTDDAWSRSGLGVDSEAETTAYFEKLFAEELQGHPLIVDRSIWRSFPTIRNERWAFENITLVGDAAHTAHFSVGSGMKLAVDGGLELARALASSPDVASALTAYEASHRPRVERTQRLARTSMEWFERVDEQDRSDPGAFTTRLLSRAGAMDPESIRDMEAAYEIRSTEGADTTRSDVHA